MQPSLGEVDSKENGEDNTTEDYEGNKDLIYLPSANKAIELDINLEYKVDKWYIGQLKKTTEHIYQFRINGVKSVNNWTNITIHTENLQNDTKYSCQILVNEQRNLFVLSVQMNLQNLDQSHFAKRTHLI